MNIDNFEKEFGVISFEDMYKKDKTLSEQKMREKFPKLLNKVERKYKFKLDCYDYVIIFDTPQDFLIQEFAKKAIYETYDSQEEEIVRFMFPFVIKYPELINDMVEKMVEDKNKQNADNSLRVFFERETGKVIIFNIGD